MITEAVIILIILLVVANVGLTLFNKVYPPCDDTIDEYFNSAKRIPNENVHGLTSVQINVDNSKKVIPNTYTFDEQYIDDKKLNNEFYGIPKKLQPDKSVNNMEFYDAIGIALQNKRSILSSSYIDESRMKGKGIASYNAEMEGMETEIVSKRRNGSNIQARKTQNDGYSNRDINDY